MFEPFIPRTSNRKDFSALEDAVRQMHSSALLTEGTLCSFLRGSSVSGYDGGIVKAHARSDVDIGIVSSRPHRRTYRFFEEFPANDGYITLPVDINNLNVRRLQQELSGQGEKGFASLNDFAADTWCVGNEQLFRFWQGIAMLSLLRLGLGYYGEVSSFTPSGAMKAINQGRLMVNPMRWWSVEYAFKRSPTAALNVARYYADVEGMLAQYFVPTGTSQGESEYNVPPRFILRPSMLGTRVQYYLEKGLGRAQDMRLFYESFMKAQAKLRILAVGLMQGKTDIDRIFQQEPLPAPKTI